ncbi:MAG: hypothetical protein UV61_C0001G0105 [Candidatus Gottesmanbacteria bacterium GW2011_GWB1_43_11]|uniref:Uncharacterized protein n=1 Tax=Candidatus Gottesmanbacteria bacterium GW2011_GWB1_43_11 TaxID=1618446 RepID=A0A0G1FLC1_9BACT|nr:MAG: hypothetical protein UV04_C0004G0047 [Candidatus Gottesmanbacteria bacterium GW2011_GWA2_42_16]KKS56070.1 MAG: hypothetical protein UV17_C0003G0042 [Candidatus Gottesmanbacteria bacterium GW2011_GWA1_42_26]KKS81619.1 MAG: hypothetical protein UV55_C0011G0013 [Candidatus Gottesmanbacteria bacterium GW2011_GWC1_43_10]KKS87698.1 MAG: hypothetical protein UV61_C0001G0105 [Candidatus Gottesmanbacteria bacterium GW2011_GWB1_43_11]OGG07512.1 MAG: hypothetical protein A2699_00500 [Candidatus Go
MVGLEIYESQARPNWQVELLLELAKPHRINEIPYRSELARYLSLLLGNDRVVQICTEMPNIPDFLQTDPQELADRLRVFDATAMVDAQLETFNWWRTNGDYAFPQRLLQKQRAIE